MKPIPIPKLTDHSATLTDLISRRDAIGAQVVVAEKDRQEAINAYHAQGVLQAAPPTDPGELRVARLLGEAPPAVVPEHRTRLAEMAQQIHDLKRAHAVLDGRVRTEQAKANTAALALVAPEYRRRIRAICDALKDVHTANVELHNFTSALDREGIVWGGLGIVAPNISNPKNPYSPIGHYFHDAADLGFIDRKEIPEGLLQ